MHRFPFNLTSFMGVVAEWYHLAQLIIFLLPAKWSHRKREYRGYCLYPYPQGNGFRQLSLYTSVLASPLKTKLLIWKGKER